MKLLLALACFFFATSYLAYSAAAPQIFPTAAGDVKITPLYHASTLIEAGGKIIYLDPAKPAKFAGSPKADLILITDIHPDHMDPASIAAISKAGRDAATGTCSPSAACASTSQVTRKACRKCAP
jgi:Beta-lactamase superfamily domain